MSRDTYYPQRYQLEGGKIEEHYIWSSEFRKKKLIASTGQKLTYKDAYYDPEVQAPGIKTMTKNRIVLDRRRRATDHFKKEIMPNFASNSVEGKHFAKKYGKK